MTYYSSTKYAFTAISKDSLVRDNDFGSRLDCGDSFKMPVHADTSICVSDDEKYLSGDSCTDGRSSDGHGQHAGIETDGVSCGNGGRVYAEQYYWVHDDAGCWYLLIEIKQEGTHDTYYSFHDAYGKPADGCNLTVHSSCNVTSDWIDYGCLKGGDLCPVNTAPEFTTTLDAVCIDENGTFVVDLDATDADGDTLTFEIVGGCDAASFEIDSETGELRFVAAPDYEAPGSADGDNTYEVTVKVSDGNGGSALKTLTVCVEDVAEAEPTCIILEAEDFTLCGFQTVASTSASGGAIVKLGCGSGALYTEFKGESGSYDLSLFAQDECDGASTIVVWVGSGCDWEKVACIRLDQNTDGGGSNNGPFSQIDLGNIQIETGEYIYIEGYSDGGEYVRIDKVVLCGTEEACTTEVTVAAEDFENGASGWSIHSIDYDNDLSNFLGRFDGCDNPTKTFELPAEASTVTVAFDLYLIDSWDNEEMVVYVDGQAVSLGCFQAGCSAGTREGNADGITWTLETTKEPGQFAFWDSGCNWTKDQIVRVVMEVPADKISGGDLTLTFDSRTNDHVNDESFGIDNLLITAKVPCDTVDPETASITGRYYEDTNGDNLEVDANGAWEPSIVGATVYLLLDGVVIATDTTDANGEYLFENLAAGDYTVSFQNTDELTGYEGYAYIAADQGTDEGIDSDVTGADSDGNGTTATITLAAGENRREVDAGIADPETSSIGNLVFIDVNGNGVYDAGTDTVAEGVTVTLTDADGNVLTDTTDANGEYLFDGLAAGDYTVGFGTLDGYTYTAQSGDAAATTDGDSDADETTGETGTISLGADEDIVSVDAGLVDAATGSISGRYFVDTNGDDTEDDGTGTLEKAVTGAVVILLLDGVEIASTETDADGYYSFDGLEGGNYTVVFQDPDAIDGGEFTGFEFVTADQGDETTDSDAVSGGTTATITLVPGGTATDVDAGIVDPETGSIGNLAFIDVNGNGVYDEGTDEVLEGVTVTLTDEDGNTVTDVTDENGEYLFDGLAAGDYTVTFDSVDDLVFTTQSGVGATAADNDSDADETTGETGTITLGAAENVTTVDAGYADSNTAELGDFVFFDANKDGEYNAADGDTVLADVTVNLYDAAGTLKDTATTDTNGNYLFSGLAAGTYRVGFVAPTGMVFTIEGALADDAASNDSDADRVTGLTDEIVLSYGESELDIDAGFYVANVTPTPADDTVMTCSDETVTVNVLANDTDSDGGTLTIVSVDGQDIAEGGSITTSTGTVVSLIGGELVIDGSTAYAYLDIGEHEVETISYTVSDGQGDVEEASASVEVTFCGDANTVESFVNALPTSATYQVIYAGDYPPAPFPAYAYDVQIVDADDDRFDGVYFENAYCLDFNTAVRTLEEGGVNIGDVFGTQSAAALAAFDANTVSHYNGNAGSDNLDLINWIVAQDFEDQGYTGWEVQFAIWELADNYNAANAGYAFLDGDTDYADVVEILSLASANEGFVAGVGDTIAMIIDPTAEADAQNVQPFIVGVDWETYDCLC